MKHGILLEDAHAYGGDKTEAINRIIEILTTARDKSIKTEEPLP